MGIFENSLGPLGQVWKKGRELMPDPPISAQEWMDEVHRTYYPKNESRIVWKSLQTLKRGTSELSAFVGKFRGLMLRVTDKSENEKADVFVSALGGRLKEKVNDYWIDRKMRGKPADHMDLIRFAQEWEMHNTLDPPEQTATNIKEFRVRPSSGNHQGKISLRPWMLTWPENKKAAFLNGQCYHKLESGELCLSMDPDCHHRTAAREYSRLHPRGSSNESQPTVKKLKLSKSVGYEMLELIRRMLLHVS